MQAAPEEIRFSTTQLASIRTSLDQARPSSAGDTLASTGASHGTSRHRNNLIRNPDAQAQDQSPTMIRPHDMLTGCQQGDVRFPDWGGTGSPPADEDDEEDAVVHASSPCAKRMQIGAEAMHGEESECLHISSGGAHPATRMTAEAEALRTAAAEEQEAVANLDVYQGADPFYGSFSFAFTLPFHPPAVTSITETFARLEVVAHTYRWFTATDDKSRHSRSRMYCVLSVFILARWMQGRLTLPWNSMEALACMQASPRTWS
jgi:hypothetical protein